MVETIRTKLKKEITDDAGVDEIKKFIDTKTASVNERLSDYFEEENVKVTSHVLRKLYFCEAWITHGIASDMQEIAYAAEILGHDELSFAASATYISVVYY